MRTLVVAALVFLGALVALRLLLPRFVHHFVYYPEPLRPQESEPRFWGFPEAEERWIRTDDGVRLHAWWFPASGPRAGAVLFLHGNAGHLAYRGEIASAFSSLGLDVLLPDYRGYGLSEGTPREEGLYRDAEAAYERALEWSGVGGDRLLVVGNSLGSAVAVELARRRPVAGLVLVGAFTSTVSVGRRAFRWLPPWFLDWERERYDVLERIRDVRAPVLVAAAAADRTVAPEEGRRVYREAPGPKRFLSVEGANHNDVFSHPALWNEIQRFARETLPAGASRPGT